MRLLVALRVLLVAVLVGLGVPAVASGSDVPTGGELAGAGLGGGPAGEEVVSLRTETSRSYRKADGGLQTRFSLAPVNYRDAEGRWRAIDPSLRRVAEGLETTAGPLRVRLPERANGGRVRIAQMLADPLEPGEQVQVSGRVGAGADVYVQAAGADGPRGYVFVDPGLADGGTATISVPLLDLAGAPVLTRPDGTQVTAQPTGADAVVATRPLAPAGARVEYRRGRAVALRFAARAEVTVVRGYSRSGKRVLLRSLATRSGRSARIALPASLRLERVGLRSEGPAGAASKTTLVRVRQG